VWLEIYEWNRMNVIGVPMKERWEGSVENDRVPLTEDEVTGKKSARFEHKRFQRSIMSLLKAIALTATRQSLVAEPCALMRRKHQYANDGVVRPFAGQPAGIERAEDPM
jgi:hypothetical protein